MRTRNTRDLTQTRGAACAYVPVGVQKPAGPRTLVAGVFEHTCVPQAAPSHTCAHTWSVFGPAGACTHVCASRYVEDGVTRGEDTVTCAVLHVHRGQPSCQMVTRMLHAEDRVTCRTVTRAVLQASP